MRTITTKQLYKTLSRELLDLPFSITKSGHVVAVVSRPIDDNTSRPELLSRQSEGKKSRPSRPVVRALQDDIDRYFKPHQKKQ